MMEPLEKVYCLNCNDFVAYDVGLEPAGVGLLDGDVPFLELIARCKTCQHEVYVPIIHDQNVMARMRCRDTQRLKEALHEGD